MTLGRSCPRRAAELARSVARPVWGSKDGSHGSERRPVRRGLQAGGVHDSRATARDGTWESWWTGRASTSVRLGEERAVRAFHLSATPRAACTGSRPRRCTCTRSGQWMPCSTSWCDRGVEQFGVEAVSPGPSPWETSWVEAEHGQLPARRPAHRDPAEGVELATGGPVEGKPRHPPGPRWCASSPRVRHPDSGGW